RYGIYHLFRTLRKQDDDTVLVPAYHHGNEIHAIVAAGWKVRFYSINRRLQLDPDELEQLCEGQTKAVFVIHYLGWPQPMAEIAEFCRQRSLLLIEDCALSLLSTSKGRPLGSFGDYAIFCLYKTLPIPNGGLVVQQKNSPPGFSQLILRNPEKTAIAGRCAELILERTRLRLDIVGKSLAALKSKIGDFLNASRVERTAVGDDGFDASKADLKMASLCHNILGRLDYEEIYHHRRRNFHFLDNYFNGRVPTIFSDLPEGVCPLFYPILVCDKSKAAAKLNNRGICSVEFWNQGHPAVPPHCFPDVQFLRQHVLELPIHQDLDEKQIEFIAQNVLDLDELIQCDAEIASLTHIATHDNISK
ncbi:MAG: aminotransferase class V-fold PLP-dependent enzyme, partial [bacterium]